MKGSVGLVVGFCVRCKKFRKGACSLGDNVCQVTFKSGVVYDVPSHFEALEVLG